MVLKIGDLVKLKYNRSGIDHLGLVLGLCMGGHWVRVLWIGYREHLESPENLRVVTGSE